MSTLKEPYRIEDKKTMGYELAGQLGWALPDVIIGRNEGIFSAPEGGAVLSACRQLLDDGC